MRDSVTRRPVASEPRRGPVVTEIRLVVAFPFSTGIGHCYSREFGNEKRPVIPGARETGARE